MGIQGSLTLGVSKQTTQNDVVFLLPFPARWHQTFQLIARKSNNDKNGRTGQRPFSPQALPLPPGTSRYVGRSVMTGQAYIRLPPLNTLALFFFFFLAIRYFFQFNSALWIPLPRTCPISTWTHGSP